MTFKDQARIILVGLIITLNFECVFSQQLNYRDIFGSDWEKAIRFVDQNKQWIEPELKKYTIPFPVAISVIFPELVRYSALKDKIEITLLKALYINLGEEYANFSIGHFQMKPSFAEKIRENARDVMGVRANKLFKKRSDYDDVNTFRSSIVSDLENPEKQINYLIAFIKICDSNFNLKMKNDSDRIRFLATAYNYGFWKKKEQIENMIDKKYFSTTIVKTVTYPYSDISLFWYHNYLIDHKP
jgi:hypothetical protein